MLVKHEISMTDDMERFEDIIIYYFRKGYNSKEIAIAIRKNHTVKKFSKKYFAVSKKHFVLRIFHFAICMARRFNIKMTSDVN